MRHHLFKLKIFSHFNFNVKMAPKNEKSNKLYQFPFILFYPQKCTDSIANITEISLKIQNKINISETHSNLASFRRVPGGKGSFHIACF